jgi:hypothetical protein
LWPLIGIIQILCKNVNKTVCRNVPVYVIECLGIPHYSLTTFWNSWWVLSEEGGLSSPRATFRLALTPDKTVRRDTRKAYRIIRSLTKVNRSIQTTTVKPRVYSAVHVSCGSVQLSATIAKVITLAHCLRTSTSGHFGHNLKNAIFQYRFCYRITND